MKIGLVGGTFDPIHQGHVLLGQAAREQFDLDEIWFLPAGQPYFKRGQGVSPARDRLAMTRRAVRDLPWAKVCDIELRLGGRSYTYFTLEQLTGAYPEHKFSFIFGADCLDQLERWKNPERILAKARIIAAGRGSGTDYQAMEEKAAALVERFGGVIEVMPFLELDLSSTLIREKVRADEDISDFVPPPVEAYIKRQGLYNECAILSSLWCHPERSEGSYKGCSESPAPLTAILFDMDGTLLDTERFFIHEWIKADGHESPQLLEALYAIIGVTREQAEAIIYERLGADYPYESCRRAVDEAFRRATEAGRLPLKNGAREILESLWQAGYKLGLASSTMGAMVIPELQSAGLYGYFDAVITGDDAAHGKPAPDIFQNAAKALGASPENCLVIEDSYNGIRAAHAAGMRAIMVPDIKSPTEEMEEKATAICGDLQEAEEWISHKESEALTDPEGFDRV